MTLELIGRALVLFALWWVLAEGRNDAWWPGLVAVTIATAASVIVLPLGHVSLSMRAIPAFLGYFLVQSARGGAQVAVMALRPRLDLAPAIVEIPVTLPAGAPRVLMVAVLGLMPGTVGVRIEEDCLRVHVLDARLPVARDARVLELRIARLFGVAR